MMRQPLQDALDALALTPGLLGCALVDASTGMLWSHAGRHEGIQQVAEACSDYWRMSRRLQGSFDGLGPLQSSYMTHEQGRLLMFPCGNDMLMITLMDRTTPLDWSVWVERAKAIARMVKDF